MKLRPAVHSVIFNLKNLNVFIYLERECVYQKTVYRRSQSYLSIVWGLGLDSLARLGSKCLYLEAVLLALKYNSLSFWI